MSCERFRDTKFRGDSLTRIAQIKLILEDYPGQKLTARQLYYQFVARGWLENTERSYKNTTSLITDARYAGLVDWDVIEDRGREPIQPSEWASVDALVAAALRQFRLPRWDGQPHYVELWVEKQALAGVLEPLARAYHATLMVNKGYSSASAMKGAADRIRDAVEAGREPVVIYLGDHDPSGEDMVRDIRDRLTEFLGDTLESVGVALTVDKLALTMAQIQQYNPPPNPAKMSDARAKAYVAKYGRQSWELDALPPNVLQALVRGAFDALIDKKALAKVVTEERKQRARIEAVLSTEAEED
jgi:hypothetical protein